MQYYAKNPYTNISPAKVCKLVDFSAVRVTSGSSPGEWNCTFPTSGSLILVCWPQPGSYRHWPARLWKVVGSSLYNFLIRYKNVQYVRNNIRKRLNFLHGKTVADKVDKAFGNEVVLVSAARILERLLTTEGRG